MGNTLLRLCCWFMLLDVSPVRVFFHLRGPYLIKIPNVVDFIFSMYVFFVVSCPKVKGQFWQTKEYRVFKCRVWKYNCQKKQTLLYKWLKSTATRHVFAISLNWFSEILFLSHKKIKNWTLFEQHFFQRWLNNIIWVLQLNYLLNLQDVLPAIVADPMKNASR